MRCMDYLSVIRSTVVHEKPVGGVVESLALPGVTGALPIDVDGGMHVLAVCTGISGACLGGSLRQYWRRPNGV